MAQLYEYPQTCLSREPHDDRVSDVVLHYSGCLRFQTREAYLKNLPQDLQRQVDRETQRTKRLRHRLETLPRNHEALSRLRDFQLCIARYRESKGAPARPKESPAPESREAKDDEVDSQIKAPVMFFRGGQPVTMAGLDGEFPSQKVSVQTLLTEDKKRNPLMWDCEADTIRYVHLPANNMAWVEEAIARYYGEDRPEKDDSYMSSKFRRDRTKAEMLLRSECWQSQRGHDSHVLLTAAALLEAMDFDTEERLITKYLHGRSPLHPRRTLDQSYYGSLKSTGTRDRDQVVYRATKPTAHNCSENLERESGRCQVCQEDSKKVPRLIMVDQLWLWILDERTVLTSFPRRWGKLRPDPSAIHKALRLRLKQAQKGEINSAFDLALAIIDQCSRVFFERPRFGERRPNMVAMFAEAIRGVTYKQTAAFDQFLVYSHLASRGHGRPNVYRSRRWDAVVAHNTLLTVNPEGKLLKEVKDIIDEIHIILKIQSQQQTVMKAFVKNIRQILRARCRRRGRRISHGSGDENTDSSFETSDGSPEESAMRKTLRRADDLLSDVQERTSELVDLLNGAKTTSSALKDLLTLKQQQAGVIEAREAVKIAAETKKQGQYAVTFTGITIIFLPLSFAAALFGMNAAEINDGRIKLSDELIYMPFSRNIIANAFARLAFRSGSLVFSPAVTWVAIKTGLYMWAYEAKIKAGKLREREGRITSNMKAAYLGGKVEGRAMRRIRDRDRDDDGGDGDIDLGAPAVRSLTRRNSSALTLGGGGVGFGGAGGAGGGSRDKSRIIDDVESGSSTIVTEVYLGGSHA
ncbi:putative ankyrin repeat protein [Eutypa lata UCREL1]|uniref:Putative ankyrin repeat protein n=1 Tax=Eutypa lata (strain UCR-EL1) TaxID=1287681 RepID=M7T675_EUTLA|nr:putative ankyrin repeat protein [Eutypa lata UCREL1]